MSKKGILLAITVLIACLFAGCGSKDEGAVTVDTYVIETESAPAMKVEDSATIEVTSPTTYGYVNLADAKSSVSGYVELMTAEENGFAVVNKSYASTPAPDFTQENGSVILAKNIENQENKMIVIKLYWAPGICTVDTSIQEGKIGGQENQEKSLTHTQAADMITQLKPSVFGLSGNSMSKYNTYIRNGLVMVNNEACMWVEVYTDENPANTNSYLGTYYLSRDGQRLYALNRADGTVKEVKMH